VLGKSGNRTSPVSSLLSCATRTPFLVELLDQAIEIGVAGSKSPCEPVPASLSNFSPSAITSN